MDANSDKTVECTGDDDCACGSEACQMARRQRSAERMEELRANDDAWDRTHSHNDDTYDDGQEEIDLQRRCDKLI